MNNKVNFLRGTATEYEASTKDNDTFYYTTDDEKLYLGNKEITGGGVTIDDTLSDTSKNPVQNKVINAALNNKAELTDIPTNMLKALAVTSLTVSIDDVSIAPGTYACEPQYTPDIPTGYGIYGLLDVRRYGSIIYQTLHFDTGVILNRAKISGATEWTPWQKLSDGGNADTVDGKHASDFALSTNPTIEGEIHLARNGNATTSSTLFAWEDTARIRNTDTDAENTTYTDLVITPNGIYTEAIQDGAYISRTKINDGGNADTLDGLHESSFAQNIGVWNEGDIKDLLLACQKSGFVWIQPGVTGMPNDDTYWFGIADCHTVHRQLIVRNIDNSVSYCMRWNNGTQTWVSWKNLADGGNAATANFATYSDYAGGSVQPTASNACLRNISAGTADLSAGVSELATGTIYLVYE